MKKKKVIIKNALINGYIDAAEIASTGIVIPMPDYPDNENHIKWISGANEFLEFLRADHGLLKLEKNVYPFIDKLKEYIKGLQ